jgi:hypothetical protein
MTKVFCDHCGKDVHECEKHSFSEYKGEEMINVNDRVIINLGGKRKYDLCADCYAELRKFVKNPIEVVK